MGREGLVRTGEMRWEIPADKKRGMRVPAKIFASEAMVGTIDAAAFEQVANAACLPGVVQNTIAMPDIHSGYGLPIGGIMATDMNDGVVSPGAAGYDINCGVRLLKTPLMRQEIADMRERLADILRSEIPSGLGRGGALNLSDHDYRDIAEKGAQWAVNKGFGFKEDIAHTEAYGRLDGGDIGQVGSRAMHRGRDEMGTLGSGNHFLEVQYVDEIYDPVIAEKWGLMLGQITVMIHTGSRGFGHQIATDHLEIMEHAMKKYGISVPDRELACTPIDSPEGKHYLAAMRASANYAWANRQVLMHLVRKVLAGLFGKDPRSMELLYDVAHNIIKMEEHTVNGKKMKVMVHRKGATRALPAGHPELPDAYRETGQPVLVPGDMGRMSYLLAGAPGAMAESFGSTCHGAGRRMSRHQALKRAASSHKVQQELAFKGIEVRAAGKRTLAEEMPDTYKDVSQVVDVVTKAGLAVPIARLRPLVVVKG